MTERVKYEKPRILEKPEALKPCPFCGGEAGKYSMWQNWTESNAVICRECGAVVIGESISKAIAAWNRRV